MYVVVVLAIHAVAIKRHSVSAHTVDLCEAPGHVMLSKPSGRRFSVRDLGEVVNLKHEIHDDCAEQSHRQHAGRSIGFPVVFIDGEDSCSIADDVEHDAKYGEPVDERVSPRLFPQQIYQLDDEKADDD